MNLKKTKKCFVMQKKLLKIKIIAIFNRNNNSWVRERNTAVTKIFKPISV